MSSINSSRGTSSATAPTHFGVDLPSTDSATEAQPGLSVHRPLASRGLSSSISDSNPIRTPFDPLPSPASLDVRVPTCLTKNSSKRQPSGHVSHPGLRRASSPSPLDDDHLSSETLTPPTSNETSPSSGSLDPAQHLTPSSPCPVNSQRQRPLSVRPGSYNDDHLSHSSRLPPHSRSSRQSYSGDTLVDQSEPTSGLGSAVLLEGSTRLSQRFYEAYRPVGDNNPGPLGIPMRRIARGQERYPTATQRAAHRVAGARPNPNDPRALGIGQQRQRQAMDRSSEIYARMAGYGQTSEFGPASYMSLEAGTRRLPARRLLSSETGTSRIVPQEIFGRQPQIMPTAAREVSNYQNRPVSWPGILHRPLNRPPTFPATGIYVFQQQSGTGRWHGSPPARFTYPPRATYEPTIARPNMGGPANYAYLPGSTPRSVSAARVGRIDFGHGPDFTMPRPFAGQAVRTIGRMAGSGSFRGRGIARGRGTGHGRYY